MAENPVNGRGSLTSPRRQNVAKVSAFIRIVECPSTSITVRSSSAWSSRNVANACRTSCRCDVATYGFEDLQFSSEVAQPIEHWSLREEVADGALRDQANPHSDPTRIRDTDRCWAEAVTGIHGITCHPDVGHDSGVCRRVARLV
ncbi:hypothetical protein ACIP95_25330 [Micromonospora parva]|uniref:hypothetical protein n=1 Tax=Micromonospora parva TaxID=1464048 RepID=UPI0033C5DC84